MSNKTPSDSPAKTASAHRRFGIIAVIIILLIAGAAGLAWEQSENCYINTELAVANIRGNDKHVVAEVVTEEPDKALGLSGRDCLGKDRGMLFPYALTGDYCFWMKDMRFPIDIIWLDDEKKVVTIQAAISPDTYPQEFCPDKPAQYIVEVNAGAAKKYDWQIGTTLNF